MAMVMMIDPLKVIQIAIASAKAEGFFLAGSLPARCHNPGDLEIGDQGCGCDNGKTKFKTDIDGWIALRHEWDLILSGTSRAGYKVTDNILQVAFRWTGNDNAAAWANTVAQELDITVTTTLQEYLDKP